MTSADMIAENTLKLNIKTGKGISDENGLIRYCLWNEKQGCF
jgi:hypothetical protein